MKKDINVYLNKLFNAKEQIESLNNGMIGYNISLLLSDISPTEIVQQIINLVNHLKQVKPNLKYSYIISKNIENWEYAWEYYVKLFVYANDRIFKQDVIDNYIRESGLVADYDIVLIMNKRSIVDCINKHIEKFNYKEYETFDSDFNFIQIDIE